MSDELHGLAGLYVVDALDSDERERFENHLAECPTCRDEVAGFRGTTGRLSQLMSESPPPWLREAIMDRIATTPQATRATPSDELALRPRRSPMRVVLPAVAAAALLIAVILGAGWVRSNRALDRQEAISAVLTAPDATSVDLDGDTGTMRLVYSPALDRSVVVADGVADLPSDRTYALWFIGPEGADEAALFRTSGGRAARLLPRTPEGYQALGVTNEPKGGSKTPTEPILYQGPLPEA